MTLTPEETAGSIMGNWKANGDEDEFDLQRRIVKAIRDTYEDAARIAEVWSQTTAKSGQNAAVIAGACRIAGQNIAAAIRAKAKEGG